VRRHPIKEITMTSDWGVCAKKTRMDKASSVYRDGQRRGGDEIDTGEVQDDGSDLKLTVGRFKKGIRRSGGLEGEG